MDSFNIITDLTNNIGWQERALKFSQEQQKKYSDKGDFLESDIHKHQSEIMYKNIDKLKTALDCILKIQSTNLSSQKIEELREFHKSNLLEYQKN